MKTHGYAMTVRWAGAATGIARDYAGYSREWVAEISGKVLLRGSADPAFRGDPLLHNPEDLLVAALSSCHLLSYLALAVRAGLEVHGYEDAATGTMTFGGGHGQFTEVVLHPQVIVRGDLALAQSLHERAHEECYIARSVNFAVRHEAVTTSA